MSKYTFIIASLLLSSSLGFAGTVSNLSISTDTASAIDATVPTAIVVFGGIAGTAGPACTANALCDTCATAPTLFTSGPTACNRRQVNPNLELQVNFRVSEVPTGAKVLVKNGDTEITVDPSRRTADASVVANADLFVKIPWRDLCLAGGLPQECYGGLVSTSFKVTLKVGVSQANSSSDFSSEASFIVKFRSVDTLKVYSPAVLDGVKYHSTAVAAPGVPTTCVDPQEGFCDYSTYPGDEKAYLDNLARASVGAGDSSEIKWKALRVLYAPGNDPNVLGPASSYKDLIVQSKTTIQTDVDPGLVDGLINETNYVFAIATVDEAENVNFFTDPALVDPTRQAKPGEVIGLLDDKKCFIATAAFGSSQDPYVFILRQFRDRFLKTNQIGASFVDFYYEHSPVIANYIAKHDSLRAVVRVMLWPLIGFAGASLSVGAGTAIAVILGLMMTGILVIARRRRQA